jgi:opacity protein-like surface antigen|nr:porin family protein [Pedobacter panaciterrae]
MKHTFIGILLLFVTGSVFAQDSSSPYYGFRLGLTAHPTIGWVKPQVGKSNGVALGFSYGLMGDFNFAENYSFATGLTITTINGKSTQIRSTQTTPATQTPYELKYKLQYIEVPLTVKLKTVKINDIRWYGQFGLSNDFNIGAKQDADVAGKSVYRDESISKSIKLYRAGLILGAGAEFDLRGNASIAAGLTYNNGFTNITTDKNNNIRNHYLGLNFGVFF